MTDLQKIEVQMSECRSRLRTLATKTDATDEEKAEMRSQAEALDGLEERFRILSRTEPEPQKEESPTAPVSEHRGEATERRELLGKVRLSNFLGAALGGTPIEGADAEASQEFTGGHGFPMEALAPPESQNAEERAVAAAPTTSWADQPQTWVQRLFKPTMLDAFRVETRSIAEGQPQWITITDGADPELVARDRDVSESTYAYSQVNISPVRHAASFVIAREDMALFSQMEAQLRQDLNSALTESITDRVINESTRFDGILAALTSSDVHTAVPAFDNVLDLAYDSVTDTNLNSTTSQDTSWVAHYSLEKVMDKLYNSARTTDNRTALDRLRELSGGVRFTRHFPAIASKKVKMVGVRNGGPTPAVLGVWNSLQFFVDDLSLAKKGQRRITAESMIGFKVLRPQVYIEKDYQTVA